MITVYCLADRAKPNELPRHWVSFGRPSAPPARASLFTATTFPFELEVPDDTDVETLTRRVREEWFRLHHTEQARLEAKQRTVAQGEEHRKEHGMPIYCIALRKCPDVPASALWYYAEATRLHEAESLDVTEADFFTIRVAADTHGDHITDIVRHEVQERFPMPAQPEQPHLVSLKWPTPFAHFSVMTDGMGVLTWSKPQDPKSEPLYKEAQVKKLLTEAVRRTRPGTVLFITR